MTDLSEAKRLIEAAGWTQLHADYLDQDYDSQREGWRLHDHPADCNVADHLCDGLDEKDAKAFEWLGTHAATLIAEHEAALAAMRAERRRAVDVEYMLAAVVQMLGPKGRAVWQAWEAAGIKRIHTSWGPEAAALTGEEIAQVHLDMETAVKNAVPCDPDAPNEPTRALLGEDGR